MTRPLRAAAVLLVLLAALSVFPAGAAGQGAFGLTEVGGVSWPYRSFVLTLPEASIDGRRVRVRENGEEISTLSVVPARAASDDAFGVALVIDASDSMRGRAIEGAIAAARTFVGHRNENQQIAVLAFNAETSVVLPFTTDEGAIRAAVEAPPPLGRGTHIYDAVAAAVDLLEAADIAAGSIVVLSDGTDTGSAADEAAVVERASEAGVRIFSVGLRSRAFTPGPLAGLAEGTGGDYAEATSSANLASLFDAIGAQLANEYLIKYRSLARPNANVDVEVTVEGLPGSARQEYMTPDLPVGTAPYHRSPADAFWRSSASMAVVSFLSAALLAIGAFALFRPGARDLRKRMAQFVSLPAPDEDRRQKTVAADAVLSSAERSFERMKWWARFNEQVELAEIRIPAVHIVAATMVATAFAALVAFVLGGSPLFVPAALAVPFVVRSLVVRKVEKRRKQFAEQLPDNLQVLASALRAGHSLVGALSVVVDDAPEPARSEFRRVIGDERLGVPLEDAFGVVVRRMESRDLEQVALVAALQRETGGNTAEVLDRVTETIRERFELRRLVKTLTAQGRMSRWIVSLLPVGLLVLITMMNPAYMAPLFENPMGRAMLVGAAVMVVSGSLVIKKIVNIKV